MDKQTKAIITQRLASASGHLCGVERMAHEDASCIDVIRQLQAVQAALNKVSVMMLETHLDTCILAAVQGEDIAKREHLLDEIASIIKVSKSHNYLIKGEFTDNGN